MPQPKQQSNASKKAAIEDAFEYLSSFEKIPNDEYKRIYELFPHPIIGYICVFLEFLIMSALNVRLRYFFLPNFLRDYWWFVGIKLFISGCGFYLATTYTMENNRSLYVMFLATTFYYFISNTVYLRWLRKPILAKFGKAKAIIIYDFFITTCWVSCFVGQSIFIRSTQNSMGIIDENMQIAVTTIGSIMTVSGLLIKFYAHLGVGFDSYWWRDMIINTPNEDFYAFPCPCKHPTYELGYLNNYGLAISGMSFEGLIMGFVMHFGIMLFVWIAEDHGIEELYGASSNKKDAEPLKPKTN